MVLLAKRLRMGLARDDDVRAWKRNEMRHTA